MIKELENAIQCIQKLSPEDKKKLIVELSKKNGKDLVLLDMFCGNEMAKKMNRIMHDVDVFEKGKQLAIYEKIEITGNVNRELLCENMKKAWEKAGGYVLFVAISHINGVRVRDYPLYLREGIQSLSMVQKGELGWIMFKKALEHLGYEVEVDQQMHVLSVK